MTEHALFTPFTAGKIDLKNRIVMAPLTRNRAKPEDDTPYDLHVEYYTQRAGAGLIITEATQITPEGKGYAWTPGIYSDAQVEGWKRVTDSVHAAGGKIVMQLWHVGRVSHTSLQEDGKKPVAPSAIASGAPTFDGTQMVETSEPRALELSEIPRILADYRHAAENAKKAGFDGIELHAANGYL
ncbi:MAG: oxidoreductase, partial [Rhodobacterales bacterium]